MANSARSGGGSMGDVKYWDSIYLNALDDLEADVSAAEGGGGNESLQRAMQKVRRVAGVRRSYQLEIKLMSDAASKAHYASEKSTKDARLAVLQKRLDKAKAIPSAGGQSKRDELFGGRRDLETGQGGSQTAEAQLSKADVIQDNTEKVYENMIGVLRETEQTASTTAVELTNQREQMTRITEEAIQIDSLLTRADRLVKVFSKRMMTDKFIQCFGCLNVTFLVAIILYVVIEKVGLPNSSSSEAPPNPSE